MWKQIIFYIVLIPFAFWVFRRVLGKEYLGGIFSGIKWGDFIPNFGSTLVTIAMFYLPPRFMIDYGFGQSLVIGLLVVAVCIGITIFLILDLREDNRNQTTDLTTIVNFSVALLLLAVNVCSALSYALSKSGIASYETAAGADYGRFVDFYIWHFIDIVPIVRAWEILGVKPPMTIGNFWAGLPVLLFKLFVILQIIRSIKEWLDKREGREAKP